MCGKVVVCGINTANLPKLKNSEIEQLFEKVERGDKEAREQFIVANMRLVLSLIKRFWSKKADSDDVFQAGMVGLIKAVDNFDKSFNVRFSTYAVPMIIGEIKRYLRDGNSMRVARSIRDTAYQALKTRSEIEKRDGDASLENVAKEMNTPLKDVVYALDAISDTVSLFDTIYNSKSGDEIMLIDSIGDDYNTEDNWTEKVALETALTMLPDKEKEIIYLRYYEGKTQTEISEDIGISQAQVSRLEKTAIKSLKSCITI